MVNSMAKVDMKLLTDQDAHNHWMLISKEINTSATTISKTSGIAIQRNHFKHLSAHLIKGVKLLLLLQLEPEMMTTTLTIQTTGKMNY